MKRWLPILGCVLVSSACGGSAAEQAPPDSAASAQGAQAPKGAADDKVPAFKLSHYSSPDGFIGIVLDRTGDNPKLRVDKSSDIIELFVEDALDRGDLIGHWMNGPDGGHWLFLGKDGELAFIKPEARARTQGRRLRDIAVPLTRDAKADPLGAPTKRGIATPPPPKTPWDLAHDKLEAIAVIKKLPQFKPEDSGNLAKIAEALQAVDASMLVRVNDKGAAGARWAPASEYIGGVSQSLGGQVGGFPTDEPWQKDKGAGLQKYGGVLKERPQFGSPSRLRLHTLKGWPPPLAANTPGLIWMLDSSKIVFVSLDGGRYELSLSGDVEKEGVPIEAGLAPQASWPPPLQHALVDVDSVRGFAKGGAVPAKVGTDIEALDDAWFECVNKVWREGQKEHDTVEASQGAINEKVGRLSGIPKKYEAKAIKDCAPATKKLEQGLVQFIEARNAERTALYEKAKARVAALGAGK
jgi:hypothetical protein